MQEALERGVTVQRRYVRLLNFVLDFLHASPSDRPAYERRLRLEVASRGRH